VCKGEKNVREILSPKGRVNKRELADAKSKTVGRNQKSAPNLLKSEGGGG